MKQEKRNRFAVAGGLCGSAYLILNNLLPSVPEFLLGLLLGLAVVFMIEGLLPEAEAEKLRKWKRRGE